MVLERLAIAKNFFCIFGRAGFATMKDCDVMACLLQSFYGRWSDEAGAAYEKNFHDRTPKFSGLKSDSLNHFTLS